MFGYSFLNLKNIVYIILVIFCLYIYIKIDHLESQHSKDVIAIEQLNDKIKQKDKEYKDLIEINKNNNLVIEQLKIERQESLEQVDKVSKLNKTIINRYDYLSKKIIAQKNSNSDGPVAKVLKDTIDTIQKDNQQEGSK